MGDQDFLVILIERNFLKLGRLLAADAPSGSEPHDVAGLAEITDPINLSMMEGVNIVHLEIPIRQKLTFQPNIVIPQPLVPECLENIVIATGKRILFRRSLHHGSAPLNKKKLPLQDLPAIGIRRLGHGRGKTERNSTRQKDRQPGVAQPQG